MTKERSLLRAMAVAALLAAGCASTRPVEDVLGPAPTSDGAATVPDVDLAADLRAPAERPDRAALAAYCERRIRELDERGRELVERTSAPDAAAALCVEAARALAENAELRLQSSIALDPRWRDESVDPKALIEADDRVADGVVAEVRSLAAAARDLAEKALDDSPDDPEALHLRAFAQSLYLWSVGPAQAVAGGGARTLPKRMEALAAAHPGFEGAAPLRLLGRFRTRAPWPYGDVDAAVAHLGRAVELAPLPINLVFLGDALWLAGDEPAARAAWERAARATADNETRAAAPVWRSLARLRTREP